MWFSQERGQAFEDVCRRIIIVVGCGMYAECRGGKDIKGTENREGFIGSMDHRAAGVKGYRSQETTGSEKVGRR